MAPVNEEMVEAVLAQRARAREAGDYASAVGRQRASARDLLFLELLFRGLARYRGESL